VGVGVACPLKSLVNASTGLPRMLIRAKSRTTLPTNVSEEKTALVN